MLLGPLHMRHLLGLTAEFGDRDPAEVVEAAVTTFLSGYAPRVDGAPTLRHSWVQCTGSNGFR